LAASSHGQPPGVFWGRDCAAYNLGTGQWQETDRNRPPGNRPPCPDSDLQAFNPIPTAACSAARGFRAPQQRFQEPN